MINNIEIVEIINNQPMTNSLKIAEVFGKEHKNVLSGIKALKCSEEFTKLNFKLSDYTDSTGKTNPMYNITKDGFVFLVMGYTGEKACRFKELYIKTFNEMENRIKNEHLSICKLKDFKELMDFLKNQECFLTWNDMIEISHKRDIKEVCKFIGVKAFDKGKVINLIQSLEGQQQFLQIQ